jgi:hypothetical protein
MEPEATRWTRGISGIDSNNVEYVLLIGTAGYEYSGV